MRYQLRSSQSEAEIALTPSTDQRTGDSYRVSISMEDSLLQREVFVSDGLVQVKEPDGSLRRLAFTPGTVDGSCTNFFYRGRLRKVGTVGGVAGRVEGSQSEGTVLAPMNGQVVKVPVKVGDRVESGEIVLILEAMKMENEVTAPITGIVVDLSVSVGQTVSPGQPMFQVESIE